MNAPQAGIFALGTASHAYLEFDARDHAAATALVGAVARLREPPFTAVLSALSRLTRIVESAVVDPVLACMNMTMRPTTRSGSHGGEGPQAFGDVPATYVARHAPAH